MPEQREFADYDSPWKEMLENYFEDFLAFFFPQAHQGIDWAQGFVFLDKELQQIVRDAELGRRFVDKLVKVWTLAGDETWVLIHIEVQGQVDTDFAERMYVYNYRLFDKYRRHVCSLAILADERADWKPKKFSYEIWGCKASLQFPIVKLLKYRRRITELERSHNPFALVVLAHLRALASRKKPDKRLKWKTHLVKILYDKGYSRQNILELLRFMDWVLVLPKEFEQRFMATVEFYEERETMRYVTSWERIGLERGVQQGVQQGLEQGLQQGAVTTSREDVVEILKTRFASVPDSIEMMINQMNDLAALRSLLKKAVTVESPEAFQVLLESER